MTRVGSQRHKKNGIHVRSLVETSAQNLMTYIPELRSRMAVAGFDFRDLILFPDDLSFSPV
jgi:hypothetical protein